MLDDISDSITLELVELTEMKTPLNGLKGHLDASLSVQEGINEKAVRLLGNSLKLEKVMEMMRKGNKVQAKGIDEVEIEDK